MYLPKGISYVVQGASQGKRDRLISKFGFRVQDNVIEDIYQKGL